MDIEIQAKEIMYHKANLNGIMAEYTGQPIDKVVPKTLLPDKDVLLGMLFVCPQLLMYMLAQTDSCRGLRSHDSHS